VESPLLGRNLAWGVKNKKRDAQKRRGEFVRGKKFDDDPCHSLLLHN
jgi:hypothetical protein